MRIVHVVTVEVAKPPVDLVTVTNLERAVFSRIQRPYVGGRYLLDVLPLFAFVAVQRSVKRCSWIQVILTRAVVQELIKSYVLFSVLIVLEIKFFTHPAEHLSSLMGQLQSSAYPSLHVLIPGKPGQSLDR